MSCKVDIETFGEKVHGHQYIRREGVYGIALDQSNNVALVKVPYGYHLPGGGREANESLEDCLKREFLEETGRAIVQGQFVRQCIQYTISARSKRYLELHGHFYLVQLKEGDLGQSEMDHELVWHTMDEALVLLSLDYQREALKSALKMLKLV